MIVQRYVFMKRFRFSEFFIRANRLGEQQFKRWVFFPGMLFGAADKWWGDFGDRGEKHPGLDLCAFENPRDDLIWLDSNSRVPALARGAVVAIMNDFLGKSIVVEHTTDDAGDIRMCSFYAHTVPLPQIRIGRVVAEGEVIATVADVTRSKSGIRSHLHLSFAKTIGNLSYSELEWKTLGGLETLELFDPIPLLDIPFVIRSNPLSTFNK